MYADDTNVTFAASDMLGLETQINTELKSINLWLKANKLSLNVAKTEFMVVSSRQKMQSLNDNTINVNVEGVIFVTCSLRELCPLIFVTLVKNCTCRNQELTT